MHPVVHGEQVRHRGLDVVAVRGQVGRVAAALEPGVGPRVVVVARGALRVTADAVLARAGVDPALDRVGVVAGRLERRLLRLRVDVPRHLGGAVGHGELAARPVGPAPQVAHVGARVVPRGLVQRRRLRPLREHAPRRVVDRVVGGALAQQQLTGGGVDDRALRGLREAPLGREVGGAGQRVGRRQRRGRVRDRPGVVRLAQADGDHAVGGVEPAELLAQHDRVGRRTSGERLRRLDLEAVERALAEQRQVVAQPRLRGGGRIIGLDALGDRPVGAEHRRRRPEPAPLDLGVRRPGRVALRGRRLDGAPRVDVRQRLRATRLEVDRRARHDRRAQYARGRGTDEQRSMHAATARGSPCTPDVPPVSLWTSQPPRSRRGRTLGLGLSAVKDLSEREPPRSHLRARRRARRPHRTHSGELSSSRPADVAQLVEHFTRNEGVAGSSPAVGFGLPRQTPRKLGIFRCRVVSAG